MECSFSPIGEEHLQDIADIINYYIVNTTVSFHKELQSPDDMREKVFFSKPQYQAFLIEHNEDVMGYCAISPWKKQEAYNRTAEINIYLKKDYTGVGIGSKAIGYLEQLAIGNNMHTLIAGLSEENIPSRKLFEKNGYHECARFREVGFKSGKVLDVIYLQKILD